MTNIEALIRPGRIGGLLIRNRLVMAAMGGVSRGDTAGPANQRSIDFYSERAKGGAGLIIMPSIVTTEANMPGAAINDPKSFLRLKEIAMAVQNCGAKMACQLGYVTLVSWPGVQQVGPSAIPSFTHKLTPRALPVDEIHSIVESWGEAAYRAREAGMDAVEIQAAHGYFLSAFQSPFLNRRNDEYGGSIENRGRFTCEVIARTRERVGAGYPILIRMNGSDFLEGGLTVEDAKILALSFVKAGVDAIDVSAATQDSRQWRDLSYMYPDGAIVHLAEAIKQAVPVPVIAVGKIGNVNLANRIIAEGKADFVAMGRGLLAEPALLSKSLEEQTQEIHGCIYCNNCRIDRTTQDGKRKRGISCTVNPTLGKEKEFEIKPAAKVKKVLVVGGGLAGMEAAKVLAERGHKVVLYEQKGELGGQWNIACRLPQKTSFRSFLPYLISTLNKSGAEIILNTEVTKQIVRLQKPDAIVISTGAVPLTLDVPGAAEKNVLQAVDVISGAAVGDRIVVIGGCLRGMEVAEALADQGKKVSLVTRGRLGGSGEPLERNIFVTLRDRLVARAIPIFTHSPVFEVRPNGVYIIMDNELLFLPADNVVLAVGSKPANYLVQELQGLAAEVHAIGDCARVRDAREAINEGAEIGRAI